MTAPKATLTAATKRTLRGLRRGGSLEDVDSVKGATVLWLAGQLDNLPPDTSPAQIASLARAFIASTKQLLGAEGGVDDDGPVTDLLAFLQSPAMMGDAREDGDYTLPGEYPPWDPRRGAGNNGG